MKENDLNPTVRPLDEFDDGELDHNQPSEMVNIHPPMPHEMIDLDLASENEAAEDKFWLRLLGN